MTALAGRQLTVVRSDTGPGPAAFLGVRTKNLTRNGEPIDISSDDGAGFRELLEKYDLESLDIELVAVLKDSEVLEVTLATDPVKGNYTIDLGDNGTITGAFIIKVGSIEGEHAGEVTYNVTLMSSGALTYTPDAT